MDPFDSQARSGQAQRARLPWKELAHRYRRTARENGESWNRACQDIAILEATNARLVAVLQEINADVSFGICVVGHKGKDAAIRRIGQAVDRALLAASSPGTPAAGEPT